MRQTHAIQQTSGRATSSGRQVAPRRAAALGHAVQRTCVALVERLEERRLLASVLPSVLVKDIHPTGSGEPESLVEYKGSVVFSAADGEHGRELWISDGTAAGTSMIRDIYPGFMSGMFFGPPITNVNGTLFFAAADGNLGNELWKSDGTAAGTVLVKDIRSGFAGSFGVTFRQIGIGNTFFFLADDGVHGMELWKSNGTAAGTVMVKDIQPGSGSSYIQTLTNVSGKLFFVADDGVHGEELWVSDGTEAGTFMVKDIAAGDSSGMVLNERTLVNLNGKLFFAASGDGYGSELWSSDGTPGGTVMVRDIQPGTAGSGPDLLTNVNGTLMFEAFDLTNAWQLWKSDGTTAGTVAVKKLSVDTVTPATLAIGNTFYFEAYDSTNGYELWKSDGTAAGTMMVKAINPGSFSYIESLTNVNGVLLFTANDGTHGYEVWTSDGTEAGTVMVDDVQPTTEGWPPQYLTVVGSRLYYSANDGVNGRELRMLVVNNQSPVAHAGGPYAVAEGGSVTLSGAASSDADGRIAAWQWDLDYDGTTFNVDAVGVSPTFSAGSLDGSGTRTIGLRVQDSDGAWSTVAIATINITNTAPTASFTPAGAVALGQAGSVRFTNAADPSAADIAGGFRFSYDFDNDGTFEITDSLQATATVPVSYLTTLGSHTIAGRITDKDGGSRSYATTLTVTPPADTQVPTASVQVANRSSYARSHSFTVTYRDNGLVRRSTIDSLDIRVSNTSGFDAPARLLGVSTSGNAATITATYAIDGPGGSWDATDNGTYSIRLQTNQVADTSGNFAAARTLGSFTSGVLAFDVPGVLQIDGTDAKDTIVISSTGGAGNLSVTHNGTTRSYVQVTGLLVLALGGDDVITLDPSVTLPATINGGAGNDQITGGSGGDLLKGGGGNDTLLGMAGADTLNGGGGADRVVGGGGNDRLIGGAGNDVIRGGAGNDTLIGSAGNDQLSGGGGNDLLASRDGLIDTVSGGGGRDTLEGDNGLDQLLATDIELLV